MKLTGVKYNQKNPLQFYWGYLILDHVSPDGTVRTKAFKSYIT
jgi:hypothetical protein